MLLVVKHSIIMQVGLAMIIFHAQELHYSEAAHIDSSGRKLHLCDLILERVNSIFKKYYTLFYYFAINDHFSTTNTIRFVIHPICFKWAKPSGSPN